MSLRALRFWGAIALASLVALSATMADAATTTRTTQRPARTGASSVSATGAKAGASTSKKRKRRARRAPPGGVYARNAVVMDPATGRLLYEKNAERSVPIASITKLMTALVLLEQEPDLTRRVEVTREEIRGGGHTQLRRGEMVSLGDLLHMSLMCSDNVATRVLVRESGLPLEKFLAEMNRKSLDVGLSNAHFVEVTGLDEGNVATATDVARLILAASENAIIHDITTTRSHAFRSATRPHQIGNTNRLLYGRYEVLGGKTGFISEAGYCFGTQIRTQGRELIAVVLGAPTNATRFADVVRLVNRTLQPAAAQTAP
jgi:D-alanyl-D-alanine endopeptidase (penicillin-binding protein 7)